MLIEIGGARLLTDPILAARVMHLRRHGGAVDVAALGRIDAVLISHAHLDHLDAASLRKLAGPGTELVVPTGAAPLVADMGFGAVAELRAGETVEVAGVVVEATLALHDGRRHPLHRAGECRGYVLGTGGRRIYFAGDTELFPEMTAIGGDGLDAALLPVWGWGPTLGPGHLDPDSAAEALTLLRPRLAIPIHWGTLFPIGLDRVGGRGRLLTDPPHEFARAAARLAPDVEIRVLEQGQSTPLPRRR